MLSIIVQLKIPLHFSIKHAYLLKNFTEDKGYASNESKHQRAIMRTSAAIISSPKAFEADLFAKLCPLGTLGSISREV